MSDKKTVLITGGSRGIGLAIAQRFSAEGYNVAVFAKSTPDGENLKQAESEIEQAGGKSIIIDMDLRDHEQIVTAVTKTVDTFGGIDILVNNTSAFCFTNSLNTTSDNFDMLIETNTRATFLMSQTCIPYLSKAENPHIINNSPPLSMKAKWFKDHLPFTLSKYGMSLCTLGMSEEFKEKGIAVNSMWPQTTIATTTIKDHFLPEIYAGSRWPTIMADAVYELSQKNAQDVTGNFFVDEKILRDSGITNFSKYAVDPNSPLIKDLFTSDDAPGILEMMQPLTREHYKLQNK